MPALRGFLGQTSFTSNVDEKADDDGLATLSEPIERNA